MIGKASFEKLLRERIRCIVFDLDGTLTYVEPEHRRALTNAALAKVSDIVLAQEDIDNFWFDRRRDALLEGLGVEPAKFWAAFNEPDAIAERMGIVRLYDDVGLLEKLGERYALALISNTYKPVALQEIEKFGLRKLFRTIILPSKEVKKPHPSALRSYLLESRVAPGEAIMVGDSDEGLITARRNRVPAVLVEREERKHSISPDYVIHGLEELDV